MDDQKLGVDFIDINMLQIFKDAKIDWADGMTPMMEARAVKNVDEQECLRIVGAIGDAAHWEFMHFLKPGLTENQVTAHIMEFLYTIPGMEDVEDVIVSSGPNTWPNWRNFSDRIIKPGDIVFMDLAALTWNGYKSCYYRTYCVGKQPTQEQKDYYATALKWLYDSIKAVRPGATTRDIALKWPSAKEAWGYEEEDQAAANLWGHGLGLAQYDQPVISRIWSLDHPLEIKAGHGVRARDPARQEVRVGRAHRGDADRPRGQRRRSSRNFPVEQITVVDPMRRRRWASCADARRCWRRMRAAVLEAPRRFGLARARAGRRPRRGGRAHRGDRRLPHRSRDLHRRAIPACAIRW